MHQAADQQRDVLGDLERDAVGELSGALGRVGAATDVLVPIVGVLVLGALMVQSSGVGRLRERTALAAVSMVALGGFALVLVVESWSC